MKYQVLEASASRAAATDHTFTIATGTDDEAGGQTSSTDVAVPTGSIITDIYIWFTASNLTLISDFAQWTVEYVRGGQSSAGTNWAGNNRRNQVMKNGMFSIGKEQNSNHVIHFKIPKKFQRLSEGMKWNFVRNYTSITTDQVMAVYKFYR